MPRVAGRQDNVGAHEYGRNSTAMLLVPESSRIATGFRSDCGQNLSEFYSPTSPIEFQLDSASGRIMADIDVAEVGAGWHCASRMSQHRDVVQANFGFHRIAVRIRLDCDCQCHDRWRSKFSQISTVIRPWISTCQCRDWRC